MLVNQVYEAKQHSKKVAVKCFQLHDAVREQAEVRQQLLLHFQRAPDAAMTFLLSVLTLLLVPECAALPAAA